MRLFALVASAVAITREDTKFSELYFLRFPLSLKVSGCAAERAEMCTFSGMTLMNVLDPVPNRKRR